MVKILQFIFILNLFFSNNLFAQEYSQKELNLYKKFNYLKYKTVEIFTLRDKEDMETGSGIIVNKNGQLYLVTCYHLLAGKMAGDTSIYFGGYNYVPNNFKIYFHTGREHKSFVVEYSLLDKYGNRKFYVIPKDKEQKWLTDISPRMVSDIVFMPLDYDIIPYFANIKLDTVSLVDKKPVVKIFPNSLLSVWGFRHGINKYNYPVCDTLLTLPDSIINTKGEYVYALTGKDLRGDSGAPVYIHLKRNKVQFTGIVAEELSPEYFNEFIEWKNKKYKNLITYIISKSFIKYALNTYVN